MQWCSWTFPKINMFVWKALMGRIPTGSKFQKRGVAMGNQACPRCGYATQTVEHLLVSCLATKGIWWASGLWMEFSSRFIIQKQHQKRKKINGIMADLGGQKQKIFQRARQLSGIHSKEMAFFMHRTN
ncbi:putative reverse transcriptase zinc-binding domain-containing protein [Helianthus annuus]|nr:putative reverse transcriptase zinc-binding domain-containing protein [Helianthus annuus]